MKVVRLCLLASGMALLCNASLASTASMHSLNVSALNQTTALQNFALTDDDTNGDASSQSNSTDDSSDQSSSSDQTDTGTADDDSATSDDNGSASSDDSSSDDGSTNGDNSDSDDD